MKHTQLNTPVKGEPRLSQHHVPPPPTAGHVITTTAINNKSIHEHAASPAAEYYHSYDASASFNSTNNNNNKNPLPHDNLAQSHGVVISTFNTTTRTHKSSTKKAPSASPPQTQPQPSSTSASATSSVTNLQNHHLAKKSKATAGGIGGSNRKISPYPANNNLANQKRNMYASSSDMSAASPANSSPFPNHGSNNGALRPSLSYNELIMEALNSSPYGMLSLMEIYEYIMRAHEFFKTTTIAWQNSIRHNLSVQKMFERIPRPNHLPGKGGLWHMANQSTSERKDAEVGAFFPKSEKRTKAKSKGAPNNAYVGQEFQMEMPRHEDQLSSSPSNTIDYEMKEDEGDEYPFAPAKKAKVSPSKHSSPRKPHQRPPAPPPLSTPTSSKSRSGAKKRESNQNNITNQASLTITSITTTTTATATDVQMVAAESLTTLVNSPSPFHSRSHSHTTTPKIGKAGRSSPSIGGDEYSSGGGRTHLMDTLANIALSAEAHNFEWSTHPCDEDGEPLGRKDRVEGGGEYDYYYEGGTQDRLKAYLPLNFDYRPSLQVREERQREERERGERERHQFHHLHHHHLDESSPTSSLGKRLDLPYVSKKFGGRTLFNPDDSPLKK